MAQSESGKQPTYLYCFMDFAKGRHLFTYLTRTSYRNTQIKKKKKKLSETINYRRNEYYYTMRELAHIY